MSVSIDLLVGVDRVFVADILRGLTRRRGVPQPRCCDRLPLERATHKHLVLSPHGGQSPDSQCLKRTLVQQSPSCARNENNYTGILTVGFFALVSPRFLSRRTRGVCTLFPDVQPIAARLPLLGAVLGNQVSRTSFASEAGYQFTRSPKA